MMAGQKFLLILLTSTAVLSLSQGKIFERCELAKKLLQLGAQRDQLEEWTCIAYHESGYNTRKMSDNGDQTKNHGLFQIMSNLWCDTESGGCGVSCHSLLNCNIADDFACAQLIFQQTALGVGNGFEAWVTYQNFCSEGQAANFLEGCGIP